MRYLPALVLILAASAVIKADDKPALTPMKTGEFWYDMYQPDGQPEGYGHLVVRDTKGGGIHLDWDFHVAYEGGSYEEERAASHDAAGKLTFLEYKSGQFRSVGAREGKVLVGKNGVDDTRVEVADDAVGTLGFALAAWLPLKEGTKFQRTELDESENFKAMGVTTYTVGKQEDLTLPAGKMKAWRVEVLRRDASYPMVAWVSDAREVVQLDWGGGALMKLHDASARELYKPQPPVLTQLEIDDKTRLVLQGDFAGYTLDEMWKKWATAEGLQSWWPPAAEIEPKVGGKYEATWKKEDGSLQWQMQGKVETWEPNKKLGFTWRWDTTPADQPDLHVLAEFSEIEGGVRVKITHSKFDPNNDDQQNRDSLMQGWQFFCVKLKK